MHPCITALALIYCPADPPEQLWASPGVWEAAHRIAVGMEWVGEGEYISPTDLRRLAVDLADCPSLSMGTVFLRPKSFTDYQRNLNMWFQSCCLSLHELDAGGGWLEAKEEAAILYQIWDWVDDLALTDKGSPWFSVQRRRIALRGLYHKLGEANFLAGRLPPPIPLWRFTRIER